MDKRMIRTIEVITGIFLIFIIFLFIISSCSGGRTYTFESLQKKMLTITKNYYLNHEDELPKEDKGYKTYTLKKMISDGSLKEVTELFKDDNMKCDGSVTVSNNNGYYIYSPYLNCSSGKTKYESTYLNKKIIETSLVEQGFGLYQDNDEYYFRGEGDKNYVKFDSKDELYRIIGINADQTIRLLQATTETDVAWDDRYNTEYISKTGINEFYNNSIDSRIKETLTKEYNDSNKWPDEIKAFIVTQDLCVGKRAENDATKNGSTECSAKVENQMFGLIAAYEYLRASLDKNCIYTTDDACQNYNWLGNLNRNTWTLTADVKDSKSVYKLSTILYSTDAINSTYSNVVFNISDKTMYTSGTGTQSDPYVIAVAK